jgi:gamma-glutamyltranspeptidase/glutathione hydrolase
MSENINRNWRVTKQAAHGRGVVAAQHRKAAEVGAAVLAKGGNAIDAAVATGLAIGTVEPWMSGMGGGGYMTVYLAKTRSVHVVDFGMIAARGLDPADYPVVPGGEAGDLFGWPPVKDDRNLKGYHSILVPGHVAGMAKAREAFGTWSWSDLIQPAIRLAAEGLEVDWFASLMIASGAADLAGFETARATYLPGGLPAVQDSMGRSKLYLKLGNLEKTLRRLAEAGPADFYKGELAQAIVADLKAGGSAISLDDLARYEARIVEPLAFDHGNARLHTAPGLTAGPTLQKALAATGSAMRGSGTPDGAAFTSIAGALHDAYRERMETMGDTSAPACTTHFNVVDAEGNMVALTQTLLSLFGSKVMLPKTGLMMNNGINWFDPVPGKPNSLAAGKRPLTNICQAVATHEGQGWFAIGASGGRRILPAVAQLICFLTDHGMDLETAFHQPRIDVSGTGPVRINQDLPGEIAAEIGRKLPVELVANVPFPLGFANPSAVLRDPRTGRASGMNEVMPPWATAVAVA